MEIKDKMDSLLNNQKKIIKDYEELIKELNIDNSINENLKLKKEIENHKKKLREIQSHSKRISQENMSLKAALTDQILNEKISILNASRKKMELYFDKKTNSNLNKLQSIETQAITKLNNISKIIDSQLDNDEEDILANINEIKLKINNRIQDKKNRLKDEKNNIIDELKREYEELKNEGISEEIIEKKRKHNDIEVKIGLNWINKAGIILLLLAVGTAMKYTYSTWFNSYMKGISGFIFGALLLIGGELLNRKGKNTFALGLCGGGTGVLYLSVFSSYFILKILNMPVSILISVLITTVSLVLSQRYVSMTICGISLVGGYLPFFSYVLFENILGNQVYIAMGYLLLLNLLVLALSLNKRWIYINYLSFILNIPCLVYLSFESPSQIISIGYAILTFVMYLGITLLYPIREKIKLKIIDVILLGLNTVTNCLLVYGLFDISGYHSYKGFLALIYALTYLVFGQIIRKNASQEKRTLVLFYITSMTFAILMIPFQFGIEWSSLGWLIEAILIITFASRANETKMEIAGWFVFTLCFISFMILDFFPWMEVEYFDLRYTLMSLGVVYVLALYIRELNQSELFKYSNKGKFLTYYKYFATINSWIYLLRITYRLYDGYINLYSYYYTFYIFVSMALVTILFSYGISKVKLMKDKIITGISIALYIIADLLCIFLNIFAYNPMENNAQKITAIIILITYNIFVFFSVKDLIIRLLRNKGFSLDFYPLSMAIYFLGVVTSFLIYQFDLNNINLIISLFFIAMSLIYIIYGFKQRFMMLRRFGLGLSIFATGKLFIFDLSYLDTTGRIIAYFCFGIILVGISFIYQKLRSSLDKQPSP
jgi:hypothetical protein